MFTPLYSHTDNLAKSIQIKRMSPTRSKRLADLTIQVPENLRNEKYFNSFYLNVLYKVASFCKWTCKCFLSFLFCFLLLFNLMFLLFLVYYCHYYLLLICCFYVYFIFSFVFALLCIISGVALSLHLKFLAWFCIVWTI